MQLAMLVFLLWLAVLWLITQYTSIKPLLICKAALKRTPQQSQRLFHRKEVKITKASDIKSFFEANIGKSFDYDRVSGVQCVDLIKKYLNDVFNIKAGSWGNAKDYFKLYSKRAPLVENFEKIKNTPEFIPCFGDICVFDGENGHICICTGVDCTTSKFQSIDLNFGSKKVETVVHHYTNFLGVLRPKNLYKVGYTATLKSNVHVRTAPAQSAAAVKISDLTADAKKHLTQNFVAILKKDTRVTVKSSIKNGDIWIKTPSGYMAAIYKGDVFID